MQTSLNVVHEQTFLCFSSISLTYIIWRSSSCYTLIKSSGFQPLETLLPFASISSCLPTSIMNPYLGFTPYPSHMVISPSLLMWLFSGKDNILSIATFFLILFMSHLDFLRVYSRDFLVTQYNHFWPMTNSVPTEPYQVSCAR